MGRRRSSVFYFIFSCFMFVIFVHQLAKRHSLQSRQPLLLAYDEYNCGCPRYGNIIDKESNSSLCSDWSTSRGTGQNVVTYTVYGNMNDPIIMRKYYNQIEDRLQEVQKLYKGWLLRLYHNFSMNDEPATTLLCQLYCRYDHFDPCQIKNLSPQRQSNKSQQSQNKRHKDGTVQIIKPKGSSILKDEVGSNSVKTNQKQTKDILDNYNLVQFDDKEYNNAVEDITQDIVQLDFYKGIGKSKEETTTISTSSLSWRERSYQLRMKGRSYEDLLIGKMWRYLPMMDPTVDNFIIRDVDSTILKREVAAVGQWLNESTAVLHAMRDHPSHNGVILAGMWGGSRVRGGPLLTTLMEAMLRWPPRNLWDYDQMILRRVVWPEVTNDILVHDSYHCINPRMKTKHRTVPFPTKRHGRYFVSWGPGRDHEMENIFPCPVQCRPAKHQDWVLC